MCSSPPPCTMSSALFENKCLHLLVPNMPHYTHCKNNKSAHNLETSARNHFSISALSISQLNKTIWTRVWWWCRRHAEKTTPISHVNMWWSILAKKHNSRRQVWKQKPLNKTVIKNVLSINNLDRKNLIYVWYSQFRFANPFVLSLMLLLHNITTVLRAKNITHFGCKSLVCNMYIRWEESGYFDLLAKNRGRF